MRLLTCVLIALVSGYVSIWLSNYYQFYDQLVSWYFPHGVRLIALFLLPFRWWCVFLFFTIMGSDAYYHLNIPNPEGISFNTIKLFAFYYLLEACAGGVVAALYKRYVSEWHSISGILWLITLSMLYRFLYLALPATLQIGWFVYMPVERYAEFFIAIQLAGYLVGFYFIAIVLLLKWFKKQHYQLHWQQHPRFIFALLGLLFGVAALYWMEPEIDYLLRTLVVIPVILFSARYGFFGGIMFAFTLTTVLLIFLFGQPGEVLLEYQPFMISYLLISFVVGAVMHENSQVNQRILGINADVASKNKHLASMTAHLSKLSQKIIQTQEQERKHLSRELHDEVGQNIVALKSAIYLLELSEPNKQKFDTIKESADVIYNSVYELMHWLRPTVLDEDGLYETLKGNYFSDKCELAGIDYRLILNNEMELATHIETAVFRICQEALTNTIKHANATEFRVHLRVVDNTLKLTLADNGVQSAHSNKPTEPSAGFGLEGINDRVTVLGGEYKVSQVNGFVIDISIPLNEKLTDTQASE